MTPVISETNFPGLKLRGRGKVRDIYELGDQLLIVATDRLSAFDVVLPTPIPDKGKVLTQTLVVLVRQAGRHRAESRYRSRKISAANSRNTPNSLNGRAMLVRKTEPAADRVRRARIHFRFRMEGLSKDRRDLRHSAARGLARVRSIAGTDFHAVHQSDHRPRRKYFFR